MIDSKPVGTPLAAHFKLSQNQKPKSSEEEQYIQNIPYANVVGNLAYALSIFNRFMAEPGNAHWIALKSLLKYLKGTCCLGILYKRDKEDGFAVQGFVDSDYAGCVDTRKSLSGYIYTVHGGVVSWKSCLQKVVALSTTEAEYMAATETVKEGLWLKGFNEELSGKDEKIILHCDSQSDIFLIINPMFHERSKHIAIKFHFIREVVASGQINVEKIANEENPADALTKALPITKFQHCLDLVQVQDLDEEN
ncbi:hypothetical protein ABFS83_06G159100 [Erythranthe nasuta]